MTAKGNRTDADLVVGVDIGGDKVAIGLVDADNEVIATAKFSTGRERQPGEVIDELTVEIRDLLYEGGLESTSVGVGICGQINRADGVVFRSPNLPNWVDVPLQEKLHDMLEMPVTVANDVNVIALGEWTAHSDDDVEDLIVVFVGTGVGGGIITRGQLFDGHRGFGAEVGHTTIVVDGRECSCGNRGCLEAYVGGRHIGARAREAAEADPDAAAMLIDLASSVDSIRSEHVGTAYERGNELATQLIRETGHYLGAGLVGIVNSFNPKRLVLGGGVIEGIPDLIPLAEEHVREYALTACTRELDIVPARMGDRAGIVGGAVLARRALSGERSKSRQQA